MLHLLKQGLERRGRKLLRPGAVAVVSDIEGGLVAAATLLETGNVWPRNDDGAGAREESGTGIGVGEKREEKKLLWT